MQIENTTNVVNASFSEEDLRTYMEMSYEQYLEIFPQERPNLRLLLALLNSQPPVKLHSRKAMAGHVTAGALIISPDGQQILQVKHKAEEKWLLPGGHFDESDIMPAYTAARETLEETGLSVMLHPWHTNANQIPFDIDIHLIKPRPEKKEGMHWHIDLRYRYTLVDPRHLNLELDPNESLEIAWKPIASITPTSSLYRVSQKLLTMA